MNRISVNILEQLLFIPEIDEFSEKSALLWINFFDYFYCYEEFDLKNQMKNYDQKTIPNTFAYDIIKDKESINSILNAFMNVNSYSFKPFKEFIQQNPRKRLL
jgi:hypothetical protein